MVVFLLQALFLIAAAFLAGALLGNLFKRFLPKKDSVSENSTRAADARLASLTALPANDDVRRSAREAAAMIPPPEPVPPEALDATKDRRRPAKKASAQTAATAAKRVKNPRQDDNHRPALIKTARRGKPDALTAIEGIGTGIQTKLFALGVFHYVQIAGWSVDEASWVSEEIGFPGRALRENWGKQAAALVKPSAPAAKPKVAAKKAVTGKPVTKTPAKSARSGKRS